ncbi:MAG: PQQ-dependent sugar dehydrogenase [Planctomycetota bacterium]
MPHLNACYSKSISALSTILTAAIAAAASVPGASAAPLALQDFEPVLLGTSGGRPTVIEFAPGVDDQCYIAEKGGRIFRFRDGNYIAPPMLDIRSIVDDFGEGGLTGFVFDPEFEQNGHFYVAYNTPSTIGVGDSMVSRFTMLPGSVNTADPMSETILFGPYPQETEGHKAGDIEFGPDGMLYYAIGDGDAGSANSLDTAIDLTDPRGKVLRFDVRAPFPHVPADNPFVGSATVNELIWTYGLRNPFRLDVDPVSGDVFVGDVGGGLFEEITRIKPATQAGMSAGWPCKEGLNCMNYPSPDCDCANGAFIDPIVTLAHNSADNACAIMGGTVVRGGVVASLEGAYIFTDFCTGRYYRVDDPTGAATRVEITDLIKRPDGNNIRFIVDFTVGSDGRVYFISHYGAEVWVLDPVGGFDTYCDSAPNSTGQVASITASGSPSLGEANLTLEVTGLPPAATGLFLMSQGTLVLPTFNGSQGTLCVNTPIYRWAVGGAADATGRVAYTTDLSDLPPLVNFQPGETWFFQYWHRDLNPTSTSNTSNGASALFLP